MARGTESEPKFDIKRYLEINPDVSELGVNPLIHWIVYGEAEGRAGAFEKYGRQPNPNDPELIFLSHEASRTGAPAVLLSIISWMRENTNIKFATIVGASGPWNDKFKALGPTLFLDEHHGPLLRDRLAQFCGDRVKAVYVNSIASGHYLRQLPISGAEVITHVHEMESLFRLLEPDFEIIKDCTDRFIAVSEGSVSAIQARCPHAIINLIPPFIDPVVVKPEPLAGGKVIVACGTIENRKGFDLFCEVAQILLDIGAKDFHMYWIGPVAADDISPDQEIAIRGLTSCVTWLGAQIFPRDHFASAHIFVLPSREDPFPLVCLEAADCGLPIICFDEKAGGMHSFVRQDAGIVVPYLDVKAMAVAVFNLMNDEDQRVQLGLNARNRVRENHYRNTSVPKILKLLPRLGGVVEQPVALQKLIDDAKIVSFDIFDTLITRRVDRPDVVFDLVEYRHTQSEAAGIPLFRERMDAAGATLASHRGALDDVVIDDIYENMPFNVNPQTEKEIETAVCTAHPMGKALYSYALSKGKNIILASDMYLDETTIVAMLRKCGFEGWKKLYLSSSTGKKRKPAASTN